MNDKKKRRSKKRSSNWFDDTFYYLDFTKAEFEEIKILKEILDDKIRKYKIMKDLVNNSIEIVNMRKKEYIESEDKYFKSLDKMYNFDNNMSEMTITKRKEMNDEFYKLKNLDQVNDDIYNLYVDSQVTMDNYIYQLEQLDRDIMKFNNRINYRLNKIKTTNV